VEPFLGGTSISSDGRSRPHHCPSQEMHAKTKFAYSFARNLHADLLLLETTLLKEKARAFLFHRDVSQHQWDEQSAGNHRITGWFGLEGTFRGHLAQPPAVRRDIFKWIRVLRAPSQLPLNVFMDGASTTSLGNPVQCFTTLMVKNFFPISSLNLPSLRLKPLLLVLLQQALLKTPSPSIL